MKTKMLGHRIPALLIMVALLLAMLVPAHAETTNPYYIGYDKPITVWMEFYSEVAKYMTNYSENKAIQWLQDYLGVNFEFIHPAVGEESSSFNLMIASGTIPDIMCALTKEGGYYSGGPMAGVEDGVYLVLNDYIKKYMPNYSKVLEDEEFRKLATFENGDIVALYNYKDMFEPYYVRVQFRNDYLKEFGMDVPCTVDEYEAYFAAVKEKHPEIYPFTLKKDGIEGTLMCAWDIGSIYGGDRDYRWFVNAEGKVQSPFMCPEYKEYLELMHKWYELGYISPDFMSDDPQNMLLTEKVAACSMNGYAAYPSYIELGLDITSGRYMRFNKDDHIHTLRRYWKCSGYDTFISAKLAEDEEKLAAVLKVIDYGYSDEGIIFANFGPKGLSWDEVDPETGYPRYNDNIMNNPTYPVDIAEYVYRIHGMGWARYRLGDGVCMATNQANPDAWKYRERWGDDETVDNSFGLPPIKLSDEDDATVNKILNNVNTHAKEMTLKYITGAADLSDYDTEFTAVLESFDYEKARELVQKAYDAFLAL